MSTVVVDDLDNKSGFRTYELRPQGWSGPRIRSVVKDAHVGAFIPLVARRGDQAPKLVPIYTVTSKVCRLLGRA